jgi:hypothetical protein
MAKGSSRQKREVRKPKADKPAAATTIATTSGEAFVNAINAPKKK